MALVPAICTQCGASVEVDNTQEAAVCKHCGTPFIVEKAINNYNTSITNNFAGANVKVEGDIHIEGVLPYEKLIENGNIQLGYGDMAAAEKAFLSAIEHYPDKWEGYDGIIKALSCKYKHDNYEDLGEIREFHRKFSRCANSEEAEKSLSKAGLYIKKLDTKAANSQVKMQLAQESRDADKALKKNNENRLIFALALFFVSFCCAWGYTKSYNYFVALMAALFATPAIIFLGMNMTAKDISVTDRRERGKKIIELDEELKQIEEELYS